MNKQYEKPFISKDQVQQTAEHINALQSSELDQMLAKPATLGSAYASLENYKDYEQIAKALAQSPGIPQRYRGNVGGCIMALDLANRMRAHVLSVMQNLYDVHGQPAWSSKYVRAQIDASGMFEPLEFHFDKDDKKDKHTTEIFYKDKQGNSQKTVLTEEFTDVKCWATAIDKRTGKEIKGPVVSKRMAFAEGWLTKPGSKWKTMPELMLMYRATSFFANMHCPGLLMGLLTVEEVQDIGMSIAERQANELKGSAGLKQKFYSDETSNAQVDPFIAEMEAADAKKD